MGNVYLAYDQSTCRLLALKQVKLKTSEVMRRAYREVLLLSRFLSENIRPTGGLGFRRKWRPVAGHGICS